MIKRKLTATSQDDAKHMAVIPHDELKNIAKMIASLKTQLDLLDIMARASGIDTWMDRDRVTTLTDEIIKVDHD